MGGKEALSQFTGSELLYGHGRAASSSIILTEGCYFVRENYGAYWLFDLFISYQYMLTEEYFQVWKLVKKEDQALITCEDGNDNQLLSQHIPFTDFPFDITIWLVDGTCILPSEY